jgi:hypothetical protein
MHLGTTFAVISSASSTVDLAQTRVGSVLVSAAVIDDVVGLVMARSVHSKPHQFHHTTNQAQRHREPGSDRRRSGREPGLAHWTSYCGLHWHGDCHTRCDEISLRPSFPALYRAPLCAIRPHFQHHSDDFVLVCIHYDCCIHWDLGSLWCFLGRNIPNLHTQQASRRSIRRHEPGRRREIRG